MQKPRSWLWSVYSLEWRQILSYRMDFWLQFLGSLIAQFGVAWFLWRAIFTARQAETVGPYSFPGMMLYYLAAPLIGKVIQANDMGHVSDEIYEGSLNRYLVYPVSFFRYKLAAGCAYSSIHAIQLVLVMAAFGFCLGIPAEFHLTAASTVRAALAIILATYLNFVIVSTIELSAFWADNVWSLVVIVRFLTGLLGGAMIPLALFPPWAVQVLHTLPFPYFISFPVETWFGLLDGTRWAEGMLVLALWSVGMTLIYRHVWTRGQYRYTGVGI